MTAFAVSVGMLPVAQSSAVGLVVGTFMTLVFIPVWFIWFVREERLKGDLH